jgi:hypothetical protein
MVRTAEVGKAGLGADRGELGIVDEDFVGAELVLPGFDGGEFAKSRPALAWSSV